MSFDPWTFFFQVLNFLVLLALLKRLLFKPLRRIMEERRASTARAMEQAEGKCREAEELLARHSRELKEFEESRRQLAEEAKAAAEKERRALLDRAAGEARALVEKERGLFAAEKKRHEAKLREEALGAAELFAGRICREVADPELHRALLRRFLAELDGIAPRLRSLLPEGGELGVEVASAFALTQEETRLIREALSRGVGAPATLACGVESGLIAGIRIKACDLSFDASLGGQVASLAARLREEG